jgi:general secretion pathway protein D
LRPVFRSLALLLCITLAAPTFAESPKSLYEKGRKLEAAQDYIGAYEAFAAAYRQKPTELRYRVAFQRTRFLAAAAHVNNGQQLREKGALPDALKQFELAIQTDPSNFAAQQEFRRTRAMIEAAEKAGTQPPKPQPSVLQKRIDEAAGPIDLQPVSPAPITLEISNDSKVVYETIAKLAGINVLFDPDYTSRRISLKLNGVSLAEALDIVAFHSNTFWRPITPNTIYVATNSQQKRKELEQSVLKTFYLSNISTATDLQDVSNALRQILEIQKVQQVASQNAIIVRGTPDQVALAEKIIGDLDKAKPEVVVEVAIMQVRKDRLRQIGINPPTSMTIGLAGSTSTGTTTGSTTGSTTGTTTGTSSTPNTISLNNLGDLRAEDFNVTIPPATATLLFTSGDSKLIQNPQIRSTDGVKASLKIGDRVPIATGSFGSGFGGTGLAGANGLVNTQFQYIDVGVNIDITPRVYQTQEIGLKLVLDVSSVTGRTNIGGIEQPIISQRKIEHDIRLKEGEINILGGIFEQTDSKTLSGIPGLGQLPFLKYLFAQERVEKVDNEIVFVMIPHIVRGQEISELNQRAIDVGTGSVLDIRRTAPKPAGAAPATQTPAPVVPQPQQQAPQQPQASTTPNGGVPPAPSGPVALRFDPPAVGQAVGATFAINVIASNAADLYSAPMQISYDPNALEFVSISNGDMLSRDGQPVALVHREDVAGGVIQANATRPPGSPGISGEGVLYTLTFVAKQRGDSQLTIARPSLRNSAQNAIAAAPASATVSIK